jgi:aspartyl-tRNA(Asn)/glutamyl-tRNA(Gln) amidotransferase subunit C
LKVTKEVVQQIAELAQLQITEDELGNVMDSMNQVLDLVEAMQAVDTTGIEPMAHPLDSTQILREDVVTEPDQRDDYQKIAPSTQDGLYLVPRVVE